MRGTLRPFVPKSWFHPQGIHRVVKDLIPRLPDVSGKLFITLTVNPALFQGPESAFEHSRDRIRRIFCELRHGTQWKGNLIKLNSPYFVKVEFHESGYAHYHIIFLSRRFLPRELLTELWGYGIVDVRRIENVDFHYLLKYVTKGGELPEWVKSRSRIRIVQASRDFYIDKRESNNDPKTDQPKRLQIKTIGERLKAWNCSALFESATGLVRRLKLIAPYSSILAEHVYTLALNGRYVGRGHVLVNSITQISKWMINQKDQTAFMCRAS